MISWEKKLYKNKSDDCHKIYDLTTTTPQHTKLKEKISQEIKTTP